MQGKGGVTCTPDVKPGKQGAVPTRLTRHIQERIGACRTITIESDKATTFFSSGLPIILSPAVLLSMRR